MISWKNYYRALRAPRIDPAALDQWRETLIASRPIPAFWLLGKTQSGKTSLIKALTGDSRAQIGNGMQPCTRTAMLYDFPDAEHCLLRFLDTRGLGEIDYDPRDDLAVFQQQTHVLIVVMKATDHAQYAVIDAVQRIRAQHADWPIVVVQTALHEAYPDVHFEHIDPYPFLDADWAARSDIPETLKQALLTQRALFKGIDAQFVAVDFTLPEDGYRPENYGIEALWAALEKALPRGYARLLHDMGDLRRQLHDIYAAAALPQLVAYSLAAGAAGAIPTPFVDIPLVTVLQLKMAHALATLYDYTWSWHHWRELGSALGISLAANLGRRELVKLIPAYGSVAGALLTAATTYALGKTLLLYLQHHHDRIPLEPTHLRHCYADQFATGKALLQGYFDRPTDRPNH